MKAYRDDYGHIVVENDEIKYLRVMDIYSYLQSNPKEKLKIVELFGKATVLLIAEELRRFGNLKVNAIQKELDQYYLNANNIISSTFQSGQDNALEILRACLLSSDDPIEVLLQELR